MIFIPMKHFLLFRISICLLVFCLYLSYPLKSFALTVISDCTELQNMKNNLSEDYELGNDIDCSIFSDGEGFEPIGSDSTPFTGTFDGKGFTISDLYINRPTLDSVGLFGEIGETTISDVRLIDADVTGQDRVGILVGYSLSGETANLDRIYTSGSVSGYRDNPTSRVSVGGIAGTIFRGALLTNSYSDATVTSTAIGTGSMSHAGGLVGFIQYSTVQNSHATGDVSAFASGALTGSFAGGVTGVIETSEMKNTFATTFPSSGTNRGGLSGVISSTTVTNSYSVHESLYALGGGNTINGGSSGGISISNFYQADPLHAVYLGTPAWDFENIWMFDNDNSLPVFIHELMPSPTPTPTPTTSSSGKRPRANLSSPSAPTCRDSKPDDTPNLFQIDVNDTQATLYFVPVSNANNYVIAYGVGDSASMYAVEFETGASTGVLAYTVNMLSPNTEYSFKIRGGKGCMPSDWGNAMTVKTGSSSTTSTAFYKNFASRIRSFFSRQAVSADNGDVANNSTTEAADICQHYTVQPGDNLWNIAIKYLGSGPRYPEIMQNNNLTSTLLKIEQTLKVGC